VASEAVVLDQVGFDSRAHLTTVPVGHDA